jgi:hypothetical protein
MKRALCLLCMTLMMVPTAALSLPLGEGGPIAVTGVQLVTDDRQVSVAPHTKVKKPRKGHVRRPPAHPKKVRKAKPPPPRPVTPP